MKSSWQTSFCGRLIISFSLRITPFRCIFFGVFCNQRCSTEVLFGLASLINEQLLFQRIFDTENKLVYFSWLWGNVVVLSLIWEVVTWHVETFAGFKRPNLNVEEIRSLSIYMSVAAPRISQLWSHLCPAILLSASQLQPWPWPPPFQSSVSLISPVLLLLV